MAKKPLTFTQRDLARALKAARAANVPVARVKIDRDGAITLELGKPAESDKDGEGGNEWDRI
jgi:tRNA(Arg) A34 adenosine deaminase TadA